jgi:hypothetical protein
MGDFSPNQCWSAKAKRCPRHVRRRRRRSTRCFLRRYPSGSFFFRSELVAWIRRLSVFSGRSDFAENQILWISNEGHSSNILVTGAEPRSLTACRQPTCSFLGRSIRWIYDKTNQIGLKWSRLNLYFTFVPSCRMTSISAVQRGQIPMRSRFLGRGRNFPTSNSSLARNDSNVFSGRSLRVGLCHQVHT